MSRYLVVGSGLYGSVFARKLAEAGHRVTVLEQRDHIGGNCFSEPVGGVNLHRYGPHAFHTNSDKVWEFVNRFAAFNGFRLRVKVCHKGVFYSFPVNLFTLNQLYGVSTPAEAKRKLKELGEKGHRGGDFKSHVLRTVGRKMYTIFFEGYTRKQWNIDPSRLSASVAKRIPVRLDFNDLYFTDRHQGVPVDGYTAMFERMLRHPRIRVETEADFFADREFFERRHPRIVYSGKVDELYGYQHGTLQYRSLRFKVKSYSGTHQGAPIVNYTESGVPHTRVVEYKYFDRVETDRSVVSYEYPEDFGPGKIPFYPVPAEENRIVYDRYKRLADADARYIVGGRLGRYLYLNMDQVIAMALADAERETNV